MTIVPYIDGEEDRARVIILQKLLFVIVDQTLYYIDLKKQINRIVVPTHLQKQLLAEARYIQYIPCLYTGGGMVCMWIQYILLRVGHCLDVAHTNYKK